MAKKYKNNVKIIAKTLPENNASTRILIKNGFVFVCPINDEDDGNVWLWQHK